MQALIEIILPVFLVIGAGYVAHWRGVFPEAAVGGLMRFVQNFALPCLLFQAISTLDLGEAFEWRLLLSFYAGAFACFFVGMGLSIFWLKRPPEDAVAIGFTCLFSNSLLLGLPITERAFGPDALAANYAIIAVHAPICYGLGVTVMEIFRARRLALGGSITLKVLRSMLGNVLIIALALGLVINLAQVPVPGAAAEAVGLIARAALPAALFGLGSILAQYRPEGDTRAIAMVCAVTLLLHPAIVWSLGKLTGLGPAGFRSAVLTSAMAPGVNAYIFANMYGVAKRVAASSVLIATAMSILSVTFWLTVLRGV
ncbi:AEC family transporter [Poseidonocella sedimentorum]|uniref:Malonate transporter n=1 Tax=Poseidonocella sedimentorum TaxID=871652 RepID=A0A1I6DIF8_9RHOB|nr:AEC family transporter [Poseidonocella sedimentorum]SFR05214.1 hypothetical protein SAMN04515673_103326 [Poseidonocella sedimentorum]